MNMIYDALPQVQGTGEILPAEENHLTEAKLKSLAVAVHMPTENRIERMTECGSFLRFAVSGDGNMKLFQANFCKDRMCPACQKRRSMKIFHDLKLCAEVANMKHHGQLGFLLLTLTVPNCSAEDLPDTLSHMLKSWDKLTKRVFFKKSILGYFRTLEITYNAKRNDYHPHFHILLPVTGNYFSRNYISQEKWLEYWQQATKNPDIKIVDIRQVKPNKKKKNSTIETAAAEVGKYATKPSDYVWKDQKGYKANPVVIKVLAEALKNRRLVSYGGLLDECRKELQLADVESDNIDLIHIDSESEVINAVMVKVFRWNVGFRDYVC